MRASLKLPMRFEPALLQADLREITAEAFVAHFNVRYYQGDWSVAPLRSIGGRADHIYPDPTAKNAFADTPLLARCPYVRHVLASFPCPQQAVRFMRLKAGSTIKEHSDYKLAFEDGEVRVHIAVVTNPEVEFVLNGVRVDMKEGESWYHNFNLPHRVANHGTADRVHLVVDCVLNEWLRELLLAVDATAPP
ncbi:MAG TPA: aspartyl/asparaginyl beta-hydroxylase domain-containing protein [Candidatus Cybelea sp.]|nr:aspartyl/asparaginyl beta-hydroxylase domain-containing protein [Candidatus Cybelea sp.]